MLAQSNPVNTDTEGGGGWGRIESVRINGVPVLVVKMLEKM